MKHTMKKLLAALVACLLLVGSVAALADDPTNENEYNENTPDELGDVDLTALIGEGGNDESDLTTLTGEGGNNENEENNDNTIAHEPGLEYGGRENILSLAPNGGASYRSAANAATETLLTTLTFGGSSTYSETTSGVVSVTATNVTIYDATFGWLWYRDGGSLSVTAKEGYTITKCVFRQNAKTPITDTEAPFEIHSSRGRITEDTKRDMDGVTSIEVYGYKPVTEVTEVKLNKATTTLTVDGTETLTATVLPENATHPDLDWESSDLSVATVDGSGIVTAVATGTATITVKSTDGSNKSATCTVTVKPVAYTVTYKVVNGAWADGTTADKTDSVEKGSKPASVPTGMKASEGYTGGAWDVDPANKEIAEAATFTYTFTEKQAATVTTAPTAKTLTYNGQAQELVTAGKADGGEIYYELGTDAVNAPSGMGADKAIPTGTEVGTYYVWYKVVGDENHTDSAAKCVTVTIAPKKEETKPEPAPAPQPEPAPAQPQPQPEPAPAPAEPAPAPAEPAPAPVPVDPHEVLITTSTSTGDFSFNTTWNAVQGADGYDVFFTHCSNYDFKLVATVPAGQPLSYDFADLNKYHGYKVIIKAWQGASGNYIKESPVAHCYTGGGTAKLSNPGSLTLKKTALTIKLGKSATVGATVKGVKKGKVIAHDGKVRYLSSDPSVVTVSRGKMKAVGAGACTVYVLTTNGIYQPVAVTVDANPTSVKLSKPTRGMKIGQTQALGAKVVLKPKGAVTTLTWVSSKPEVVSVDAYGNVTALSKGRATITVTTANGKKTKLNIRVK